MLSKPISEKANLDKRGQRYTFRVADSTPRASYFASRNDVSGQRGHLSDYETYPELEDYSVSFCFSKHVRVGRKPVAKLLNLLQRVWKSEIRKPNSVV